MGQNNILNTDELRMLTMFSILISCLILINLFLLSRSTQLISSTLSVEVIELTLPLKITQQSFYRLITVIFLHNLNQNLHLVIGRTLFYSS